MAYKYSVDPILLANFVEAKKGDRIIDLEAEQCRLQPKTCKR